MIVVTGGAGFIGSNIVAALAGSGERVAVCDHLRQADKWRNLTHVTLADVIAPEALLAWLTAHTAPIEAPSAISCLALRDARAAVQSSRDLLVETQS